MSFNLQPRSLAVKDVGFWSRWPRFELQLTTKVLAGLFFNNIYKPNNNPNHNQEISRFVESGKSYGFVIHGSLILETNNSLFP